MTRKAATARARRARARLEKQRQARMQRHAEDYEQNYSIAESLQWITSTARVLRSISRRPNVAKEEAKVPGLRARLLAAADVVQALRDDIVKGFGLTVDEHGCEVDPAAS